MVNRLWVICAAAGILFAPLQQSIGADWAHASGPVGGVVQAVAVVPGSGGTELFGGTWAGGIYRFTSKGGGWAGANLGSAGLNVYSLCFGPAGGGTGLYAGTWGDGILVSTDSGATWSPAGSGLTDQFVTSLAVAGPNLLAGTDGGVFLSTDQGGSWNPAGVSYISSLGVDPFGHVFAGTDGGVVISPDNGITWNPTGLSVGYVSSFWFAGGNTYAGTPGGIYVSSDTGATWNGPVIPDSYVFSLTAEGPNLLAGTAQGVLLSTDAGTTWGASGLTGTNAYAIAAGGANVFAGTDNGIFVSSDAGVDWVPVSSGLANGFIGSLAFAGSTTGSTALFAGTQGGGFFGAGPDGTVWQALNNGLRGVGNDSILSLNANVNGGLPTLLAGTNAGVFRSTDSGATWQAAGLSSVAIDALASVPSGTGGVIVMAGSAANGVFVSTDEGSSWTASGLAGITSLSFSGKYLFAGTPSGLFRSTDNGITWSAAGLADTYVFGLAPGTGVLFAATDGGLYESTDGGSTWTSTALAGVNVYNVALFGPAIYAATDADVMLSTDNGADWAGTGLTSAPVATFLAVPPAPAGNTPELFAGTMGDGIWNLPLPVAAPQMITASAGSNGSISPAGPVPVGYGFSQSFLIRPDPTYHTDSLRVDGTEIGAGGQYLFTDVTGPHSIGAHFSIDQYTITSSAGSNGAIVPAGSVAVDYGGTQSYAIRPSTGYHVDSLLIDGVPVAADTAYQFSSVTANHAIRAVFRIDQYTITTAAGPNGTVKPAGPVTVNYGSSKTFTITPGTGYHIDSLLVDGVAVTPAATYTFSAITASHSIRAVFAINQYAITASAGTNGSIAPQGTVMVSYGGSQTFTFTPSTGYHVGSLTVDGISQAVASSYTFTGVVAAHTIRVTFAINHFTITSSAGANGTISPLGPVSVSYGSSQSFSLVPATGYHVDSLVVDGLPVSPDTAYTFSNVVANHTIRVSFLINQYAITSTAGPNGGISPSGTVSVNYGGAQTYTMLPATGYHVDSLIVDGLFAGSDSTYTFPFVTSGHSIRAVFRINQYPITATAGANGTITPSGQVLVTYGGSQTFTFSPNTGYHVDSLIVDGVSQPPAGSYTCSGVTSARTVRVVFAINQYTITASSGPNGSVAPSGVSTVVYGSSARITFSPAIGYHLDSLLVDGVRNTDSAAGYTFAGISADHQLRAVFAIDQFSITSSAGANGTISPAGQTIVTYGSGQSYTFTPATGYHVDSLIVDGAVQATASGYTFTTVTGNHTIRVTFAINQYTIGATAGPNGSINPPGTTTVSYGGSQAYAFLPATGYHVDSVIVDGAVQAAGSGYTFSAVTGPHTIRVTFAINTYTITAGSGLNGSISPSGVVSVAYGGGQAYTFTPATGYHVDSLIVDGVLQTASPGYTFTGVTGNHTIRVSFAINTYPITASAGQNGSISPPGTVTVNYGGSQAYSFTPATGYHIDSVIVDGSAQPVTPGYTFTAVSTGHTIRVTFAINQYAITVITNGEGSVLPPGPVMVNYGGTQSFIFRPNKDCHVDSLFVDSLFSGSDTAYVFVNVTSGHFLRVVFAVNTIIPLVLNDGWNMVAVPVTMGGYSVAGLFPTAVSRAFTYSDTYAVADTLRNGAGYWLRFAGNQTVPLEGIFRGRDSVSVSAGWNLIGSVSSVIPVTSVGSDPAGMATSGFFGYAKGYAVSDSIVPGRAYWVKTDRPGKLILSAAGGVANRIRIVMRNEIPPPPPNGSRDPGAIPTVYALRQNYPNPFNPTTVIEYDLPADGRVSLRVFDLLGREVAVLVDRFERAGSRTVWFDAGALGSGVYFYRLQSGSFTSSRKLVVVK
ncbi:MAG TPA: T9SS type A sorting domain-containing protein [Bacteroidota bacterium]|nr:T9SS type A sorting domain-containing protein [Bacteroidota bacterium]